MSNYIKATNFFAKDALLTGNPDKRIKGAEIDAEYNAIATSVSTKANLNSPNFTGTPTVPTAPSNTNTTQVASTAFVQNIADTLGTIATQDANSVAITGGSITGITDLSPADGGTGTSSLAGVVIGNGTNPMTARLPGDVGNVLTSTGGDWISAPASGIGVNQTWQNMMGSRVAGTTYTNTTGRPIYISVSGGGQPSSGAMSLTVSGVLLGIQGVENVASARSNATMTAIIPNNATYIVQNVAGWSLVSWAELR